MVDMQGMKIRVFLLVPLRFTRDIHRVINLVISLAYSGLESALWMSLWMSMWMSLCLPLLWNHWCKAKVSSLTNNAGVWVGKRMNEPNWTRLHTREVTMASMEQPPPLTQMVPFVFHTVRLRIKCVMSVQ